MEIERKFLVKELPAHLEDYPSHLIEQAYLCTSPVVRIRRQDEDYYLTYKGAGLMAREEYNLPLSGEAYRHLLPKADGTVITKRRFVIPLPAPWKGLSIELDLFSGVWKGLMIAEVEFPSQKEAEAFLPPEWFGTDVTFDGRYHNSWLSQHSPGDFDAPSTSL